MQFVVEMLDIYIATLQKYIDAPLKAGQSATLKEAKKAAATLFISALARLRREALAEELMLPKTPTPALGPAVLLAPVPVLALPRLASPAKISKGGQPRSLLFAALHPKLPSPARATTAHTKSVGTQSVVYTPGEIRRHNSNDFESPAALDLFSSEDYSQNADDSENVAPAVELSPFFASLKRAIQFAIDRANEMHGFFSRPGSYDGLLNVISMNEHTLQSSALIYKEFLLSKARLHAERASLPIYIFIENFLNSILKLECMLAFDQSLLTCSIYTFAEQGQALYLLKSGCIPNNLNVSVNITNLNQIAVHIGSLDLKETTIPAIMLELMLHIIGVKEQLKGLESNIDPIFAKQFISLQQELEDEYKKIFPDQSLSVIALQLIDEKEKQQVSAFMLDSRAGDMSPVVPAYPGVRLV